MLTSDFAAEAGALIRSLEQKVRLEPALKDADYSGHVTAPTLDHIERAIVSLIALYLALKNPKTDE